MSEHWTRRPDARVKACLRCGTRWGLQNDKRRRYCTPGCFMAARKERWKARDSTPARREQARLRMRASRAKPGQREARQAYEARQEVAERRRILRKARAEAEWRGMRTAAILREWGEPAGRTEYTRRPPRRRWVAKIRNAIKRVPDRTDDEIAWRLGWCSAEQVARQRLKMSEMVRANNSALNLSRHINVPDGRGLG